MRRVGRTGISPVAAGAILLAVAVVVTYFGFAKHVPFTHGFRLNAVFENAQNIKPGSPVRIAGVNVGVVKSVKRAGSGNTAVVQMEIQDTGLPIHKDATLKIRPRIFLEGNFFVDIKPGTPSSPTLDDQDTVPVTQTASPVQLDEVLTSLQSDTRTDLQDVLEGYGQGLQYQPNALDDADQDPAVRGENGATALNNSYRYSGGALRYSSQVNQALLGTQPGDLSRMIRSLGVVAAALDSNEGALKDLLTNLNVTTGAFASEATNLSATIRLLAPTLRNANRTFSALNAAFPPTRAFAREILPGVRETPATITASFPWIRQTRALLGPRELRGLARELQPTTAALGRLTDDSLKLLPQIDLIDRCLLNVVLPAGDIVVNDGPFSIGNENYKGFWYTLVALSGEGQNFDGNGQYVRFQPGGGPFTVSTGSTNLGGDQLFGNAISAPLGTRPRFPGRRPPYRPDVQCASQRLPDVNGPAATAGPAEQVRSRSARAASAPQPAAPRARKSGGPSVVDQLARRLNPFARMQGDTP